MCQSISEAVRDTRCVGGKAKGHFIPPVYGGSDHDTGTFCRFELAEVFLAVWIMTLATVMDNSTMLQSSPATSSAVGHSGCLVV
jgi:hypothetical protein